MQKWKSAVQNMDAQERRELTIRLIRKRIDETQMEIIGRLDYVRELEMKLNEFLFESEDK